MITLLDGATGEAIGTIDEETLEFLINALEEEWSDDHDYYFDQNTIDFLRESGADENLLTLLEEAISETGEADIRWIRS